MNDNTILIIIASVFIVGYFAYYFHPQLYRWAKGWYDRRQERKKPISLTQALSTNNSEALAPGRMDDQRYELPTLRSNYFIKVMPFLRPPQSVYRPNERPSRVVLQQAERRQSGTTLGDEDSAVDVNGPSQQRWSPL